MGSSNLECNLALTVNMKNQRLNHHEDDENDDDDDRSDVMNEDLCEWLLFA